MAFLLVAMCLLAVHQVTGEKSDIRLNPAQMIANHGYPSETHLVTTEDGYIITLYRIPHGINNNGTTSKPPVLLMHGVGSCAGEFVALGPKLGLSYILADAGYDVWLGNARGTDPSRQHTSLNADSDGEKFFNFTWHEIGFYDNAALIDHILQVNGDDSLHYVGHSQGTTAFLVLASTRPEYNSKIKLASLMAPAAIIEHSRNLFSFIGSRFVDVIWNFVLPIIKIYELKPLTDIAKIVLTNVCEDYTDNKDLKWLFCKIVHIWEVNHTNETFLPILASNCPSSSGIKQWLHYGQLIRDGGFRCWNYGSEQKNFEKYGTKTPPDYNLSQISAPIAFYYAENDGTVPSEDERKLVSKIPNVVVNYLVPDETFGHIDFAMHSGVVELVYNKLINVMSGFQ